MTVPLLLLALGGVLLGGVISLRAQGASTRAQVVVAVLAALALVAGVLRLLP